VLLTGLGAPFEDGPASAFREESSDMVAILELPPGRVGLTLDELGTDLAPFCASLAFCLAIRSCSICALPDKTGGKVGIGSAGVTIWVEFDVLVDVEVLADVSNDTSGSLSDVS